MSFFSAASSSASGMLARSLPAIALLLTSSLASADIATTTASQAGYYRMNVGDVEVVSLSDGTVPLDVKLLQLKDRAEVDRSLKQAYLANPIDTSVNAFLIKTPGHLVLVDAGTAELFGPSLGKLPATLRRAGYAPEQVTDILITHIHTDHTGGLMQGTEMVFPKAVVHVERKEVDYWLTSANKVSARADQKVFFDQAVLKFKPYVDAGKVEPFEGAKEIVPGITSMPTPGHTPGHTSYVLESNGQRLVFWGDIVHVAAVQFPDPTVTIDFDVDPKAAEATRMRAFGDAARKGYLVAGAHIPFPGIGHVMQLGGRSASGDGKFRFVPIAYLNNAALSD